LPTFLLPFALFTFLYRRFPSIFTHLHRHPRVIDDWALVRAWQIFFGRKQKGLLSFWHFANTIRLPLCI